MLGVVNNSSCESQSPLGLSPGRPPWRFRQVSLNKGLIAIPLMKHMERDIPALIEEIRGRIELLESNLPTRVDAMAVSPISKLPYKGMLYREALVWRMAELGREALESFEKNRLVSAIVLTRAAVETSAALWYLCKKVDEVVKSGVVGDIDNNLMRLMMGSATGASADDANATDSVLPRPIKVGDFLKQVEKDIKGFSHQYGILSEYAHPNWAGTALLYSKPKPEDRSTIFGQNIRGSNTKNIGVVNLSVALMMFDRSYNRIADLMPTFISLCENRLQASDIPGTV